MRRRARAAAGAIVVVALGLVAFHLAREDPVDPTEVRGSPEWALALYGDPDAPSFKEHNIVSIDILGRTMFVHRRAERHFLRLARLFEARAPEYASTIATRELDDWSYEDRNVRGASVKSSHAFGIAIDINALSNVLGTTGDMPMEVVLQWKAEGGEWGGDWSRPDPMHFETHLTPEEIRARYRRDGAPRAWYLEELTGG